MKRAVIVVLDSFGIGATADAHRFGDLEVVLPSGRRGEVHPAQARVVALEAGDGVAAVDGGSLAIAYLQEQGAARPKRPGGVRST